MLLLLPLLLLLGLLLLIEEGLHGRWLTVIGGPLGEEGTRDLLLVGLMVIVLMRRRRVMRMVGYVLVLSRRPVLLHIKVVA